MSDESARTIRHPNFDAIRLLDEQIKAHPGKIAHGQWTLLRHMYVDVFVANGGELLDLVNLVDLPLGFDIELIQNVRPSPAREEYIGEVFRTLHNYVAATGTLIDQTHRVKERYEGSEFETEYAERLSVLNANSTSPLLKKLRNFMLHRSLPDFGFTHQTRPAGGTSEFLVWLKVESLLAWDGWNVADRTYLNGQEDGKLVIAPVVSEHLGLLGEFHDWVQAQFESLHGTEVDEANALMRQRAELLLGGPVAPPPPADAPPGAFKVRPEGE
ncbi:MAG: hypothetical protein JWO77_3721 [Ilumatobacteraceae bacterium]|nr:hypothetical protein [Ilumatobacteraceae bacterium]